MSKRHRAGGRKAAAGSISSVARVEQQEVEASRPEATQESTPRGVIVVALCSLLGVVLFMSRVVTYVLALFGIGLRTDERLSSLVWVFIVVYLLFAVGYAYTGWALLRMRGWARQGNAAVHVAAAFVYPVGMILGLPIAVGMVWYLFRPRTRDAFQAWQKRR